jgi:hypothetical protein
MTRKVESDHAYRSRHAHHACFDFAQHEDSLYLPFTMALILSEVEGRTMLLQILHDEES